MTALVLPLGQAATADSASEWWRIIGLVAISLMTIVALALIFRPRGRGEAGAMAQPGPNGGEPTPGEELEFPGPRLLQFESPIGGPAPPDTGLAAERLRQVISQGRGGERTDRRRLGDRRQASEGEGMETGEQETTRDAVTEAGGLDAEALEEQLKRLFGSQGEPGKIVPFTPRKAPTSGEQEPREGRPPGEAPRPARTEHAITHFPVDTATRDGITATIQELLFCANVGELLHGFALYTDRYLFQFMDESRMTEDQFREAFSDVAAKDPSEWTRIDAISDFVRLDDGRVAVRVRYIDGSAVNGVERFTMRFDPRLDRWLIDDIQAI